VASNHALVVEAHQRNDVVDVVVFLDPPRSEAGVGCANSVSRGEDVFVDQSALAVAALDAGRWWRTTRSSE
jgi:hypothetical protein